MEITIEASDVCGEVFTPCSKSYAQRALACALLAEGKSVISNLQMCDDTVSALNSIKNLGAKIESISDNTICVVGGLNPQESILNIGESGLAARLFSPIVALCGGQMTIIGEKTMLKRPIGMMISPLQKLGVKVECDDFLPITITGRMSGGEVDVDGSVSSQFITGLLIALPLAERESVLHINNLKSIPYIDMTMDTIEKFGGKVEHNDYEEFFIRGGQKYTATDIAIEGDWSSASFMLVAGAIAGEVTVKNMDTISKQADAIVVDILARMGAEVTIIQNDITVTKRELNAFEADLTHCPDLFPILAVLAANCSGVSYLRGAKQLVHKESNRAEAILNQFIKIGVRVVMVDEDTMEIMGSPILGGVVESCGDHRIAMAAAVAGLTSAKGVTINDAQVVSKSYPNFWNDFKYIMKRT